MYNLLDVIEVLGVTDKQMGGIIIWRSHSLTAGESSHFVRKAIMLRPCQRRGAIEGISTSQLSTTTPNQIYLSSSSTTHLPHSPYVDWSDYI